MQEIYPGYIYVNVVAESQWQAWSKWRVILHVDLLRDCGKLEKVRKLWKLKDTELLESKILNCRYFKSSYALINSIIDLFQIRELLENYQKYSGFENFGTFRVWEQGVNSVLPALLPRNVIPCAGNNTDEHLCYYYPRWHLRDPVFTDWPNQCH